MAFLNGTPFFLYIDYIDGYCKYPFVARGQFFFFDTPFFAFSSSSANLPG